LSQRKPAGAAAKPGKLLQILDLAVELRKSGMAPHRRDRME
jgi:hypothetical protein